MADDLKAALTRLLVELPIGSKPVPDGNLASTGPLSDFMMRLGEWSERKVWHAQISRALNIRPAPQEVTAGGAEDVRDRAAAIIDPWAMKRAECDPETEEARAEAYRKVDALRALLAANPDKAADKLNQINNLLNTDDIKIAIGLMYDEGFYSQADILNEVLKILEKE